MVKRFFFFLSIWTAAFTTASAQTKSTKDTLLDVICKCVTDKKSELANASTEDLQRAIEGCFVGNGLDLLMKYAKEQNIEISDQDAMQKLGLGLGMDLVKMCPVVMELSMDIAKKGMKTDTAERTISPVEMEAVTEKDGTIEALHTATYPASIELRQTNGTVKKLFLISEFYTADEKFYNTAYMTGKKVKIGFSKQKVFMPASKKFEEIEVVYSLNHP